MRLAELSRRSGVPRSTIKFYLREGLLAPGAATARNQASYGSQHLERLELIRGLREVAGLPLEAVGRVTRELDRGWEGDPINEALRALHAPPAAGRSPGDAAALARLRAEVREFLRALPWAGDDERALYTDEIAANLLQVRRYLYPDYPVSSLARYAEIAWLLSEAEFALAPGGAPVPLRARGDDLAEPTRRAILGSLLFERIFAALRRSANATRAIRTAQGLEVAPARARAARRTRGKRARRPQRKPRKASR
jgi:DNA-binding transcriptional MerR regulator